VDRANPAELDVPYPERLSRGKAFFKLWLLSLPHWLVVAVFLGWWNADWYGIGLPGLLPLLALIGGVALLFTGRYPRDVFRLVVGMARWVARFGVYVGLMRDEYPPFRLDDELSARPGDQHGAQGVVQDARRHAAE
jgi:Domain of unknown function (DUF4389)